MFAPPIFSLGGGGGARGGGRLPSPLLPRIDASGNEQNLSVQNR